MESPSPCLVRLPLPSLYQRQLCTVMQNFTKLTFLLTCVKWKDFVPWIVRHLLSVYTYFHFSKTIAPSKPPTSMNWPSSENANDLIPCSWYEWQCSRTSMSFERGEREREIALAVKRRERIFGGQGWCWREEMRRCSPFPGLIHG